MPTSETATKKAVKRRRPSRGTDLTKGTGSTSMETIVWLLKVRSANRNGRYATAPAKRRSQQSPTKFGVFFFGGGGGAAQSAPASAHVSGSASAALLLSAPGTSTGSAATSVVVAVASPSFAAFAAACRRVTTMASSPVAPTRRISATPSATNRIRTRGGLREARFLDEVKMTQQIATGAMLLPHARTALRALTTKKKAPLKWDDATEAAFLKNVSAEVRDQIKGDLERDANFAASMGVGGAVDLGGGAAGGAAGGDRRLAITSVDDGGFELDGDVFVPSAIACLSRTAFLWRARTAADVTAASLRLFAVVHPRPEIVIVGLGAPGPRPRLEAAEAYLRGEGIALEAMDTANAVHTYNILNDERRPVACALLTVTPRAADEFADPFFPPA